MIPLNYELMRAPLNWAIVTVILGFGFLSMAVIFPDLFIPNSARKA